MTTTADSGWDRSEQKKSHRRVLWILKSWYHAPPSSTAGKPHPWRRFIVYS